MKLLLDQSLTHKLLDTPSDDYPRWRWKKDGRKETLAEITPIEAKFELEPAERELLAEEIGNNALVPPYVTFERHYNGELSAEIDIDEEALISQILEDHPQAQQLRESSNNLQALLAALEERIPADFEDEYSESFEVEDTDHENVDLRLVGKLKRLLRHGNLNGLAREVLEPQMPKFFRFSEYQKLEGRVEVEDLRTASDELPGASSTQTARALLRLADTDINSLTDEEFELRKAELEAVSSELSREMSRYWSTNPELRVEVNVEPVTVTSYNKQSVVVRYLNFRIEDRRHDFTNNFDRRSSGYQWFFSFLVAFSEFRDREESVVILLDEPGLTLHAKAQQDFLRFINDELAPRGQVIYTTHSPFMVEQIERVRVVEDKGDDLGSTTTSQSLEVGEESAFPLQAALGYELSQNLFIGSRNLLVEGPSDFAYLDLINRYLRESGRAALDESWRILPAGGMANVPAFVSLLGRKVKVTVLLDSGTQGVGRVEAAMHANKIASNRIVVVGSVLNRQHSDIEDLFTPGDYLTLYNGAFNTEHRVADLPKHPDRLVLKLEQLDGRFDHWKPAQFLLRNPTRVKQFSTTTLRNFEELAKLINATTA